MGGEEPALLSDECVRLLETFVSRDEEFLHTSDLIGSGVGRAASGCGRGASSGRHGGQAGTAGGRTAGWGSDTAERLLRQLMG